MYIGLGIVLLIAGLVLVLDVILADIPYVDDETLGMILIAGGALALVLSVAVAAQRRRTTVVHEHEDRTIQ